MEKKLSLNHTIWKTIDCDEKRAQSLAEACELHPALAKCLVQRGYQTPDAVHAFLDPKIEDLHNPYLMHDMKKAVQRLKMAIQCQEATRVVTDYDADGTTSSLILQSTLEVLGLKNISYHIPHRMKEGYGFSVFAAQCAVKDGISLIVTADIGVRDVEAIDYAVSHGIDVIVVDHHLPEGAGVPTNACAVLCPPQKACSYPNPSLAACGISLKLAQALLSEAFPPEHFQRYFHSLIKLAAIGTVADVVSLKTPENRAIVSLGLIELNEDRHAPGLDALLRVSQCERGQICSENIGYRIAPRINAAGRLESARAVVDLLRCRDLVEADQRACELDSINEERQQLQEWMLQEALCEAQTLDSPFIVILRPESEIWHRGVIGIVAGRLREILNRPVALASECCGKITGSIRSTRDVHAVKALDAAAALLTHYGGHAAAAGFSLDASNFEDLKAIFIQSAIEQSGGQIALAEHLVALELSTQQINDSLCDALLKLQPCGNLNEEPLIMLHDVELIAVTVLKDKHIRGEFESAHETIRWIWFNSAAHISAIRNQRVDILGHLRRETWRNRSYLNFLVTDMRVL